MLKFRAGNQSKRDGKGESHRVKGEKREYWTLGERPGPLEKRGNEPISNIEPRMAPNGVLIRIGRRENFRENFTALLQTRFLLYSPSIGNRRNHPSEKTGIYSQSCGKTKTWGPVEVVR